MVGRTKIPLLPQTIYCMLVSMLLAFVLSRRFHGALYVLLLLASLGLISLFSAGIPTYQVGGRHYYTGEGVVLLSWALPLSFPLFASVRFNEYDTFHGFALVYQVYFLGFLLKDNWVSTPGFSGGIMFNFTVFDYVLYYSFFMVINIAGVVVGYALDKVRFRDKLRQTMIFIKAKDSAGRRKLLSDSAVAAIGGILLVCSLVSSAYACETWSRYTWALESFSRTRLFIPGHESVVDPVSLAFKNYVVMFPLQVFLALSTAIGGVLLLSLKLLRKTFTAGSTLLISSALMLFEASKILEVYRWASLGTTTPPLSYYSNFLIEASDAYEAWFPLYIQIGLIFLAFGVVFAIMTLKEHFETRREVMPFRSAGDSPVSGGTML